MIIRYLPKKLQTLYVYRLFKFRFLFNYLLIAFGSVLLKFFINQTIAEFLPESLGMILSVSCGIIFAFALNVRYNFKIPIPKRKKAFLYYASISISFLFINFYFSRVAVYLEMLNRYASELALLLLFFMTYAFHRKFSFKDLKIVGIAVSAAKKNINTIYSILGDSPDFIHLDICSDNYDLKNKDFLIKQLKEVRSQWENKEIHCHILDKNPSNLIDICIPFVDTIVFQYEINEDIMSNLKKIIKNNKKAGICLEMSTPVKALIPYMKMVDEIMLLNIADPIASGQKFDIASLDRIDTANELPYRDRVDLCVDGGINENLIHILQVEKVISGASVFKSDNPMAQLIRLQTSSQYEAL